MTLAKPARFTMASKISSANASTAWRSATRTPMTRRGWRMTRCTSCCSAGIRWAAALRPGNAPTQRGALPMLKRILQRLQELFPKARILVRLDGGFAEPELFTFLDEVGADYVVGLAKNEVLERCAALDMISVRE